MGLKSGSESVFQKAGGETLARDGGLEFCKALFIPLFMALQLLALTALS